MGFFLFVIVGSTLFQILNTTQSSTDDILIWSINLSSHSLYAYHSSARSKQYIREYSPTFDALVLNPRKSDKKEFADAVRIRLKLWSVWPIAPLIWTNFLNTKNGTWLWEEGKITAQKVQSDRQEVQLSPILSIVFPLFQRISCHTWWTRAVLRK